MANYPKQRAYSEVPRRSSDATPPQAGTNDSNKNNYIEDDGDDNWINLKLEYVLPIGSLTSSSMVEYHLKDGILQSGATGGHVWIPSNLDFLFCCLARGVVTRVTTPMKRIMMAIPTLFPVATSTTRPILL